ncbi:hypothetical protein D3C80_1935490 [compost metagenome]
MEISGYSKILEVLKWQNQLQMKPAMVIYSNGEDGTTDTNQEPQQQLQFQAQITLSVLQKELKHFTQALGGHQMHLQTNGKLQHQQMQTQQTDAILAKL